MQHGNTTRRLWLLGGLRIKLDRTVVRLPGKKAQALLASLALQATPMHREALADLLWPSLPTNRVRRNLSDTIYRLRRRLGKGWLAVEGDTLALRREPNVWADVWEFERLSAAGDPASLQAAVELYAGDLLPENYDDWLLPRRVLLRESYLNCLAQLAARAESDNQMTAASEWYHRLAQADPLREDAQRGLMRSLAHQGKLAQALEAYTELEERLARELNVAPAADTRSLAATLQHEFDLSRKLEAAPARPRHPAFVGRVQERAALITRLEQAQSGNGGLMVLLGEAGIGKTRLLDELAEAAGWRGCQVALGRGEEFGPPAPYAPLRQALRAALPRPRMLQLSQLVQPIWLKTLAALVLEPEPAATASGPEAPAGEAAGQLQAAMRAVLRGLQTITPHVILLDDMQWADPALWPILDDMRPLLADVACLVIVTGREAELKAQPDAWATVGGWDRAGIPIVRLAGLAQAELGELGAAQGHADMTPARLDRLHRFSGGNPLLALSLLQAQTPESLLNEVSLDDLMQGRLNLLSPDALTAAQAAAVLGYEFDYGLWEQVLDPATIDPSKLPGLAGEAEQAGVIALGADSYRFAHDTLRAYIYGHTPPQVRRALHARALEALRLSAPAEATQLLHHAQQAGQRSAAARHALAAGEQMLAAFNHRAARKYFETALSSLESGDLYTRYRAVLGLTRALDVLAERDAQRNAVGQLTLLAESLAEDGPRAEAAWQAANLEWITGQFNAAREIAAAGIQRAEQAQDVALQARLLETAGRAARDLGDYGRATEAFLRAREIYEALDDRPGVAWLDGMLGLVAQRQGKLPDAIRFHAQAMEVHRALGNPIREMRAASGLAVTLWMTGDYAQARSIFEHTLELSQAVDDRRIQESSLANLGALADIVGDFDEAVRLKEQALALSRRLENKMGIALGLSNLGITYYKLERLKDSLRAFDEAIELDQATGRRQGEAYSLHGRGLTLMALDRLEEAHESLARSHAIRLELDERDQLLATEADLALLALATGDTDQARRHIRSALDRLEPYDRADLREQAHYGAHGVWASLGEPDAALQHLLKAEAAMHEVAAALPAEARQRALQNDPLHRKVQAAAGALASKKSVRLARAGVPLGRRLTDDDFVTVTWTIRTPEDDQASGQQQRRQVLQRLMEESQAQGAVPTDDDLANALGVSRRTILRDMAALRKAGARLPTRRRAST